MSDRRSQFKANLLKKVIIRLDYEAVIPNNLLDLSKISELLEEKGFNNYSKMNSSQINVSIFDENLKLAQDNNEITHRFLKNKKIEILINKNMLALTSEKYFPFEDYMDTFNDIVSILKKTTNLFTIKRIGTRKINSIIIDKYDSLLNIFKGELFSYNVISNLSNNNIDNTNVDLINRFESNGYKFNIRRILNKGFRNDDKKNIYQVILDFDGYSNSEDFINDTELKEMLKTLNDNIFDMFSKSITEEFYNSLVDGVININGLVEGVEQNE